MEFLKIYGGYFIQHCFICRPSDSIVSEDAEIELREDATSALKVRTAEHYMGHISSSKPKLTQNQYLFSYWLFPLAINCYRTVPKHHGKHRHAVLVPVKVYSVVVTYGTSVPEPLAMRKAS